MPLTWTCSCGKSLRVADEFAGRQVRCPVCKEVSTAPANDPGFEVVEEAAPLPSPPPPPPKPAIPRARAVADSDSVTDAEDDRPKKRRRDQEDDEDRPWNKGRSEDDEDEDRPRKRRRSEDDEDEDERPRKKKSKAKAEKKSNNYGMERGILNGGVLGGVAAMLIAVIWFVVGLLNDFIFFYPPVLFILGLIAAIKGAIQKNDS